MLTDDERAFLARATRTMQIIVGALAWGVILFFLVVVFFLRQQQPGPLPGEPILTYISGFAGLAAMLGAIVVPGMIIRGQRKDMLGGKLPPDAGAGGATRTDAERELGPIVASYQTALIVRSALVEGAAFFCLVAYMLEGQTLSLFAAGVLLAFLLRGIPTKSRVEDAVEFERTTIKQLRPLESIDAR